MADTNTENSWGWADWTKYIVGTGADVYKSTISGKSEQVAMKEGVELQKEILKTQAASNAFKIGDVEVTTGQLLSVVLGITGLAIAYKIATKK